MKEDKQLINISKIRKWFKDLDRFEWFFIAIGVVGIIFAIVSSHCKWKLSNYGLAISGYSVLIFGWYHLNLERDKFLKLRRNVILPYSLVVFLFIFFEVFFLTQKNSVSVWIGILAYVAIIITNYWFERFYENSEKHELDLNDDQIIHIMNKYRISSKSNIIDVSAIAISGVALLKSNEKTDEIPVSNIMILVLIFVSIGIISNLYKSTIMKILQIELDKK